jgi:adenosylhomocysteine nucleosidase
LRCTGKGAAAILEKKIQHHRPESVICAGFAGGLQSGLRVGDIILDPQNVPSAMRRPLERTSPEWHWGTILSVDAILTSSAAKSVLGTESDALCCDMETAALREICANRNIPFFAIRSISDTVATSLKIPSEYLLNPKTHQPDILSLAGHLLRTPSHIPALAGLLKNSLHARKSLHRALLKLTTHLSLFYK